MISIDMQVVSSSVKELIKDRKVYLFDFDGTICNLDELNLRIFAEIFFEKYGLEFNRDHFMKYISGRGSIDGIREFLGSNGIEEYDISEIDELYATEKRRLLDIEIGKYVYLMPGISEFLTSENVKDIPCAVVTSSRSEYVEKILSYFGMYNRFNAVFDRFSVKNGKPYPDIYINAMKNLNTNSKECIAFEDSLFGLKSSKDAGIYTVGILNKGWNDNFVNDIADVVIDDYRSLI